MNEMQELVTSAFAQRLGTTPSLIIRAPGRVNIIGEHTDYNDGFVLPMAIDRAVWLALRPRTDQQVILYALDMDDEGVFRLDDLEPGQGWLEYVKGVAHILQEEGFSLQGWEGVMAGDVPIGAGLSSSAGLELAAARAFTAVSDVSWNPKQMARFSQRAENEWVGMNCGIMDQMISAMGVADHALLIDCRSLETENVPLPPGTNVIILDTATRRGLVDSAYNERRQQCEAAAAYFGVPALRDVSVQTFNADADGLDDLTLRRARHVITENNRTLQAAAAMRAGDALTLGQLMDASHVSMRDDFEISSPELDHMVDIAQLQPGCYGARMTGGGFAGCAVALVESKEATAFAENVSAQYAAVTGLDPQIYICTPTDGAEVIS